MTKNEVRLLGWAYGKIERALGDKYVVTDAKFANACSRPISGFATIHAAAIREHCLSEKLKDELAEALESVEIDDIGDEKPEPCLSLEMQGVWQLAYMRGKNGDSFLIN